MIKTSLILTAVVCVLSVSKVFAAGHGWTTSAPPENIEIVRGQGFIVSGGFDDPASCGRADKLFVAIDHPQYELLYSTALSALAAGHKLQAYSHSCTYIGWHGGDYNTLGPAGAMYIRK